MKKLLLLFFIACLTTAHSQLLPPDEQWVEQTLGSMKLDEKIGQLFVPVHTTMDRTSAWIRNHHIGGLWFARVEAKAIAAELNALQQISKVPLLVTVDFEKGAGTYVDGATDFPINMALGASRDPALVYQAATVTAREARALGVHVNFAPVMDVNNNPKNPVINTRSYGENPQLVATLAEAAIRGYQDHGLLATGKHFPGHGNTGTDSHAHLGVVSSDRQEFESVELLPYKEVLQRSKPSAIMTAHLWIRAVDNDTIPATLSPNAMSGLLRQRLNFDGVIYTDAMVMGGITTRYPYDVATVKAIQAGCDVILFPGNLELGILAIKNALAKGDLSEQRIEESVRRILRIKTRVGLQQQRIVEIPQIESLVGTAEHYAVAKRVAAACLTLAKDTGNLIPIPAAKKILVLTMSNKEGNSMVSRGLVSFPEEVRKHAATVTELQLSDSLRNEEIESALIKAREANIVLVGAYVKIVLNSGTVDLPAHQTAFLKQLTDRNPNTILVSFGNPYIGASVPFIPTYVCAYDNARALQETAAEALFGKTPFRGKLPVTVGGTMNYGGGIQTR
ncbi:MAG: glycoside hydrolase family 3 C-terminal domain-containing protein [Ignavibacteriales bacterium]|nr:glycoside hydrolase family 3 C-terminal domain-containing protein [Ignavibacteriales bacterium]